MNEILIRNIFHMLCYAFHVLRQQNYADIKTEDFQHVQDMLAAVLTRGIAQQLKQGLYRTYVTYNDDLKKQFVGKSIFWKPSGSERSESPACNATMMNCQKTIH